MSASTVLIVNDHAPTRELISGALRGEGVTVEAFASALQCLEQCDFRSVACAVVNQDMEDMSGFQLAKTFQSGWLDIPTILLAEAVPAGLTERAEAGVIAVLGMPPETSILCNLVRKTVTV